MNSIIIKLKGGLGNQMFQYAFGKRIAYETGATVRLDTVTGFKEDYFGREYSLNNFNITLEPASQEELKKYLFYSESFLGRGMNKMAGIMKNGNGYIFRENKQFQYQKELIRNEKEKYYDGYWQDENYFRCIREILLMDFELKDVHKERIQDIDKEITSANSVAIHVRTPHALVRGAVDTVTNAKYENLKREYYLSAIEMMKGFHNDMSLFVFTNDISYAENLLTGIGNVTTFCNNDYEDICLFSRCRHQIISNSTFSWWGAWMNTNKDKKVIATSHWFRGGVINPASLLNGIITI